MATTCRVSVRSSSVLAGIVVLGLCGVPSLSLGAVPFLRGDVDSSGGLTLLDVMQVLRGLFDARSGTLACLDAADADDSGSLEVTDGLFLLNALFANGPVPPPPFPDCGEDLTPDTLGCVNYLGCPGSVFGMEVDADAIVFVVDRSGSMMDRGEFLLAKREIARVVENLAESVEFAVVGFDSEIVQFPGAGAIAPATPDVKEAASAWLDGLPGGPGTCPLRGLVAGLELANSAASPRRAIVHVSDGGGTCHGADEAEYLRTVLDVVADRNTEGVIIHAIGMVDVGVLQREFLTRLARDNGGVYVELTRWPAP